MKLLKRIAQTITIIFLSLLPVLLQGQESPGDVWLNIPGGGSLYNNEITNLAPLEGLTGLTNLNLWDNNISDISPLVTCTNLNYLRVENNNLTSLPPMGGFTDLISINLAGNNISDITPLLSLPAPETIYLQNNPVSMEEPEALRQAFPGSSIYF